MKSLTRSLLLALAVTTGGCVPVQAQTLEQSIAALEAKDYRTALAGFKKLAESGNADAQYFLGVMYANGAGVPKEGRRAVAWYRKAAEQGLAIAQYDLGVMFSEGRGASKDERQAAGWYRKAAEQGHADAQYFLGLRYAAGLGVPKDEPQAIAWVRKAAKQGNADAQYFLGGLYADGVAVLKDEKQAVVWYRSAAEHGNASAQFTLGVMYSEGRGVPEDEKQAAAWYRRAAEQGHAKAQFLLGLKYGTGRGVPKDEQQAIEWVRKAATSGDAGAQYVVGGLYANGQGVPKDEQQAVTWYRKAAGQGDDTAQFKLGLMYAEGRGVPKDEQSAYFWWLLASAQGNQNAVENRDVVERSLSSEQRAAAQTAARNWQPKTAAQSSNVPMGSSADIGGSNTEPSRPAPSAAQADSSGSGFRVASGAIVTNHHVIDGCSSLRVNGTVALLRGSDARSDLALLGVTLPGPSASLRAQRAAVGEPVAVAGFPLRGLLSGFNLTTGNLSCLSGMGGDTRYLQITAPVQPGNSGGPMLDSAGNLMGVVVSKLDAIKLAKITGDMAQNVNFALNANVLRSFLDANSVDYANASSDKPLAPTAIAEEARGFTVLVECWK